MKATIFHSVIPCPICYPTPQPDNVPMYFSPMKRILHCAAGHAFEVPITEIELTQVQIEPRTIGQLSEPARAAVAWLHSPSSDGLTVAGARLRIREKYGSAVEQELLEFFAQEWRPQ